MNQDGRRWYALICRDAEGAIDFKLLQDRPTSETHGVRWKLAFGPYQTRAEAGRVAGHRRVH